MAKSPNITTAPTGHIAPFGLRMLPELRQQIEEAARKAGRSMNAEIVARLQASFGVKNLATLGLLSNPEVFSAPENYKELLKSQAEQQRDELIELIQNSVMPTFQSVLEDVKKQEQRAREENQQLLEELRELKESSQIKKPKA